MIAVSITLSYPKIIAIHTAKNNTHSIFLKRPLGLLAHFAFDINLWPSLAIRSSTTASHRTYDTKLIIPTAKLAGRITASITAYVGLQLANTGPSDIPSIIVQNNHFFWAFFHKVSFDLPANQILVEKFFHKSGKIVIIQNAISIPPLNVFHTIGSTQIKAVDAFNIREKNIMETLRAAIIIYGLNLSFESSTEAPSITGKSGNTQGAKIVRTQDKNDTIRSHIIFSLIIN